MKQIQKLCAATMLLFALSFSAVAGDIHTPLPLSSPPESSSVTAPGEFQTGEFTTPIESNDFVTEITLSLLQLLSVF